VITTRGSWPTPWDKPQITADVVSTWLKLGENRPTLCFAVNRAHARSLERDFRQAGVGVGYVDGNTDRDERQAIREAFERGDIKVVVNVGVLTTGVDWDVRCLILARPTKSEMLYVQIIGRGLRSAPGKQDCVILDHSDTTLNLGFVTDIHHERLSDGTERKASISKRRERPTPLPKECPSCHHVKPIGVHKCPACGFAPHRVQDVHTAQGELAHLGGKQLRADMETKRKWFAMLLWYEEEKQYRHGWAANKYREKFGVWPNGMHVMPVMPDVQVNNWIKSTQIRWIKGQQKAKKLAEAAQHAA